MDKLWTQVTPSDYAWEREALAFLRTELPDREPYRAWSNFEFIAQDGSINEVDLLVLSPKGLFLVEIKSHPGEIGGDAGTWVWTNNGRRKALDNPRLLADRKAKKLASLLKSQRSALKGKERIPFRAMCAVLIILNHKDKNTKPKNLYPKLPHGANQESITWHSILTAKFIRFDISTPSTKKPHFYSYPIDIYDKISHSY